MKRLLSILITIVIISFSINVYSDNLYLSGESYILIEESSGRVLMGKNEHKKMPMASTTKVMTALIALEEGNLEDEVLIGKESTNIEGSSLYLKEGEIMSLKDLLYGLMLRSGNDSAVAIANHIGEDEEDFIRKMNLKAKNINANNTSFTNPHGLTSENHYSTAYDLALITKEAFKFEEFKIISATKSYKADREINNYFVNKNKTLWEYEGGDGVKIGYTIRSGRCLVSSANKKNMRLIAVCLNAPDWFNDNYKLFDYGFENYDQYVLYNKNQFIKKIHSKEIMEPIDLVTESEFIYPLTKEERDNTKFIVSSDENIKLPVLRGEILGNIKVYVNGILVKSDNLVANKDVKKPSILERIFNIKRYN